jgi:hypothetical protein
MSEPPQEPPMDPPAVGAPPGGSEHRQLTVKGMAWNTKFPPAAFFEEFDAFGSGNAQRLFDNLHRRD